MSPSITVTYSEIIVPRNSEKYNAVYKDFVVQRLSNLPKFFEIWLKGLYFSLTITGITIEALETHINRLKVNSLTCSLC